MEIRWKILRKLRRNKNKLAEIQSGLIKTAFLLGVLEFVLLLTMLKGECYYKKECAMGTFLKYVFYIVVIVVLYLVARGIYDGSITEKTTVGEVVSDVDTGSKELVKEGYQATKESIENMEDKSSAQGNM